MLLTVAGAAEAAPTETSTLSDLRVGTAVDGDVFVFAGDIFVEMGASVSGDLVAVGGDIRVAEGARIDGHVVAVFGSAEV